MAWILAEQMSRQVLSDFPTPVIIGDNIPAGAVPGSVVRFWIDVENIGRTGWLGIVMDVMGVVTEESYTRVVEHDQIQFTLDFQMPGSPVTVNISTFFWDLATDPSYGPASGSTE